MSDVAKGVFLNPNNPCSTFDSFSDQFLEDCRGRNGLRPRSNDYAGHVKVARPHFGHLAVSDNEKPERWRAAHEKFLADPSRRRHPKRAANNEAFFSLSAKLGSS